MQNAVKEVESEVESELESEVEIEEESEVEILTLRECSSCRVQ